MSKLAQQSKEQNTSTFCKNFGFPNRVFQSEDRNLLQISNYKGLDFTDHQNKFQQSRILQKCRKQFQQSLHQLFRICTKSKYSSLICNCEESYIKLAQILVHYESNNHNHSYMFEMHKNSTTMKSNILKLLGQCERENKELKKELEQILRIKDNYEPLKEQIGNKERQVEELKEKVGKIQNLMKEKERKYSAQIQDLRDELIDKNKMLRQQKQMKEAMRKEVEDISMQVKTLNVIEDPKKKSVCFLKSQKQMKKPPNQSPNSDQDLLRCLFIQAISIQSGLGMENP